MLKGKLKFFALFIISLVMFLIFAGAKSEVKAAGSVSLSASKSSVYVGDEFTISVRLSGMSVATLSTRMTIDTSKITYVSGPGNSNYNNGRVIYTWTDPNAGGSPLTGGTIATFKMKAKAVGTATFGISGEFYDVNENSISPSYSGVSVKISTKPTSSGGGSSGGSSNSGTTSKPSTGGSSSSNKPTTNKPTSSGSSSSGTTSKPSSGNSSGTTKPSNNNSNSTSSQTTKLSNNANLKELHLDVEGISPNFSKNTTKYYINIDEGVNNINVNAITENKNAEVKISGNRDLKNGKNTITIKVTAEDKKTTKTYTIEVTKANISEKSNTNLTTLAIENVTLEPSFNNEITEYKAKLTPEQENLNILAVPENQKAKIEITGQNNLAFGENKIIIKVVAEDEKTNKEYVIIAYRQTEEERMQELEQTNALAGKQEREDAKKDGNGIITAIVIGVIAVIILAGCGIYFYKKRRN